MTPSDWDVVREAIAKVEPPSDIIACGCIGLNDEQGRCRCEQDYPAGWALHRLQAENERLREALREIADHYPTGSFADGFARRGNIARRALVGEPSPQAGDLLVIPYTPGDPVPVGWTVEGDKMWRRADGTELA